MIKYANAAVKNLYNNPSTRIEVMLCLDKSGSMKNYGKIQQLNNGIKLFYDSIKNDEYTVCSAEIAIVTFGEFPAAARCVRDFSTVDLQEDPPELVADGYTPLGEGVNLALDLIEKRKAQYKANGVSYYRPILIIMSDGKPEGHDPAELTRAYTRVAEMTSQKKVLLLPISIGTEDNPALAAFMNGQVFHMKDGCFKDFFSWLHKSVSDDVAKTPGEELDFQNLLKSALSWSTDFSK